MSQTLYPFTAIVGQERMKTALVLNAVNPSVGGVLIRGEKGTAKSTAVRSLAALLPTIEVVQGCPFSCEPDDPLADCPACSRARQSLPTEPYGRDAGGGREPGTKPHTKRVLVPKPKSVPGAPGLLMTTRRGMRVVELPLGVTEDRLTGTLNLEEAVRHGKRRFEPGLLAAAHRGVLYVDEVNLLEDHLVDLLLDAAAMGINTVEREGVSVSHPSRFLLIGTMNPEEGELRPQLLDRFGLCVDVTGIEGPAERAEIVRRRLRFEADPVGFRRTWEDEERALTECIETARKLLPEVVCGEPLIERVARLTVTLGVQGHRGDLVMVKTAATLAALDGRREATAEDLRQAAELVLPHRMRRTPFEDPGLSREALGKAVQDTTPAEQPAEPSREPASGEPPHAPDAAGDRRDQSQASNDTPPAGKKKTPRPG